MLNSPITRSNQHQNSQPVHPAHSSRQRTEGRRAEGRRSNRLAWLVVDGQTQGFQCNLREFSSDGAHLTVPGLMGIPDQFSLYVEPDSVCLSCAVTLRRGNSVQVNFTDRRENVRYRDLAGRR